MSQGFVLIPQSAGLCAILTCLLQYEEQSNWNYPSDTAT